MSKPVIIIIDDDEGVEAVLSDMLEGLNFSMISAASGKETREWTETHSTNHRMAGKFCFLQ